MSRSFLLTARAPFVWLAQATVIHGKTKNPATGLVSRVWKVLGFRFTCLPGSYSQWADVPLQGPGGTDNPGTTHCDAYPAGHTPLATSALLCSCTVSSNFALLLLCPYVGCQTNLSTERKFSGFVATHASERHYFASKFGMVVPVWPDVPVLDVPAVVLSCCAKRVYNLCQHPS